MNEEIDYIHQYENVVYIFSLGAGSDSKDYSDYEVDNNNISEIIDYKSGKKIFGIPVVDFLDVKRNIKEMKEKGNIDTTKYRLNRLLELLEFYLLNTILDIVLIGFSHGCVIIHAVILKIKIKYFGYINFINRITICSVGSPNIIPPDILSMNNTNKVFNVYNIKDKILLLGNVFKITKKDYIPDLSYSHIKTLNFNTGIWQSSNEISFEYSFDKEKRIIYINIENILKSYKISNPFLKQSLRHIFYLNLIALFKNKYYGKFILPRFLTNFNSRLMSKELFSTFIDFDRYLYLYLQNKDDDVYKQIEVIQKTNHNNLLEILDIKDLFHLYPLFSQQINNDLIIRKINSFRDEFIMSKLHLLTLYELKLLLRKKEINMSMETRNQFLKELNDKTKIKEFKLTILNDKEYAQQTINLLLSLFYIHMLSKSQRYEKLMFMKDINQEEFNKSLEQLDREVLHSIYIKAKNLNINQTNLDN